MTLSIFFPKLDNEEVEEHEMAFFIDEEKERAYWLDDGLMYAPYDGENIYGQHQQQVTFEMIESDLEYYMEIIDALKAV